MVWNGLHYVKYAWIRVFADPFLPVLRQNLESVFICDALRDLVLFLQFKKREKHPWSSVNFRKVELYKWYQIAQRNTYVKIQVSENTSSRIFYEVLTLKKEMCSKKKILEQGQAC